jgi:hypothetical protein
MKNVFKFYYLQICFFNLFLQQWLPAKVQLQVQALGPTQGLNIILFGGM